MYKRLLLALSLLLAAPGLRAQVSPDADPDLSDEGLPASDRADGALRPVGARTVAYASNEFEDGDSPADAPEPEENLEDASAAERFEAGEDESIYIVQRRAYSKMGNFEVTPIFYTKINPKWVGYGGAALSVAYHLRENFSVELMASLYNLAFYSALPIDVFRHEDLTPEEVDLKQLAVERSFAALESFCKFV